MHPRTRFMTPVEACRPHKANMKNYNTGLYALVKEHGDELRPKVLSAPAATVVSSLFA